MVASSWVTIAWALATPAADALVPEAGELAEELAEVVLLALVELELLELLELQAASTAAAVIAAPGASQRFHLCVIAGDSSIPPLTSGA